MFLFDQGVRKVNTRKCPGTVFPPPLPSQPIRRNVLMAKDRLLEGLADQGPQKTLGKFLRHGIKRDNPFKVIPVVACQRVGPLGADRKIFHADLTT